MSALSWAAAGFRIHHIECGCGRRYTPAEAAKLPQLGLQKIEGEPSILLFNCRCGSTLAIEVTP